MQTSEEKLNQWNRFSIRVQTLLKRGPRSLRKLSGAELSSLIDDYQVLTADLARARSLGASRSTVDHLNRISVAGHNLLYGHIRRPPVDIVSEMCCTFAMVIRRVTMYVLTY